VNAPGGGISAVAAPIVDSGGHTIAAIGIEGQGSRLSRGKLYELAPAVIEATRKASSRAGGAPRPSSKSPKPSASVSPKVRILADVRALIGEGPIYDAANDRLFWIDMYNPTIFRLDRKSDELRSFVQGEMVTALALAPEGLFVAAQSGLWLADPETGERIRNLGHPEAHIPANRFNDAKCDSRNRLWVNTVDFNFARGAGALYRRDAGGEFRTMDTGLNIPNGIGWSPDSKMMYLADSADRLIYAYDFDEASGDIANRRVLVRFPEDVPGAPDGLTVDRDGKLWVAIFDGWRVSRFSAKGVLIEEIIMPVPRPTSCTFGGQNGEIIFVTSARIRVSGETLKVAPHSGAVFEIAL
jgi:sugar lactone lactonase YvrE